MVRVSHHQRCAGATWKAAGALGVVVLLLPRPGWAQPQCPTLSLAHRSGGLNNETSSTVLPDLTDTRRFYVLPPPTGRVALSEVSFHPNNSLCEQLFEIQGASREVSGRIGEMALSLEPFEARLDQLTEQLERFRREAAALAAGRAEEELLDELLLNRETLQWTLEDLRLFHGCPDTPCPASIQAELDALAAQVRSLDEQYLAALQQLRLRSREQAVLMDHIASLELEMDQLLAQRQRELDGLLRRRAELAALYSDYARLEGGTAAIVSTVPWSDNVRRLQSDNPLLTIEPIETMTARIHAALAPGLGTDSYLALHPMLLSYLVNGASVDPRDPTQYLAQYPEQIRIDATISLVASCAQGHPDRVDLDTDVNGLPLYGLSVSYAYPVRSPYRARVKYNLWQILEYLRVSSGFREVDPRTPDRLPAAAFRLLWLDEPPSALLREQLRREQAQSLIETALRWASWPLYVADVRPRPVVAWSGFSAILPPRPVPSVPDRIELYALDRPLALAQYERGEELSVELVVEKRTERWRDWSGREPTLAFVVDRELSELRTTTLEERHLREDIEWAPTVEPGWRDDLSSHPRLVLDDREPGWRDDLSSHPRLVLDDREPGWRDDLSSHPRLVFDDREPGWTDRSWEDRLHDEAVWGPTTGEDALSPWPGRDNVGLDPAPDRWNRVERELVTSLAVPATRQREARLTIEATRALERRESRTCGWQSVRCPGILWSPADGTVVFLARLRHLLDLDRVRELSGDVSSEQTGATLYVP